MKQCSKCGEVKPLTEYYGEKTARDGVRPECKACNLAARKLWYAENKDREIARVKAWQQANAARVYERNREYRRANPDRIREGHLKRTFGITLEDFEAMLAAQGGGCAICGRPAPEGTSLHVDHDHETGVVRGLLCFTCNGALGMLTENEDHLLRAADYVSSGGFVPTSAPEMLSLARTRAVALTAARGA
jgi:5-methylcytosine-specific restriction endonuclease McrA